MRTGPSSAKSRRCKSPLQRLDLPLLQSAGIFRVQVATMPVPPQGHPGVPPSAAMSKQAGQGAVQMPCDPMLPALFQDPGAAVTMVAYSTQQLAQNNTDPDPGKYTPPLAVVNAVTVAARTSGPG